VPRFGEEGEKLIAPLKIRYPGCSDTQLINREKDGEAPSVCRAEVLVASPRVLE